jgi:ATP-binding cassette, subfamily B, bacterial
VGTGGETGHSVRAAGRSAALAARLAWAASPLGCLASGLLVCASGVVPAATAWLQRAILNSLVAAGPSGRAGGHAAATGLGAAGGHVVALAMTLAAVGLAAATAPYALRYIEAEMRRRLGLLVQDNLYQSISSFPGLSRFESPRFADKLQLVQQIASGTASSFLSAVLGAGQTLIVAVTLGTALYVISPAMTGLVAASAVPAVWAQVRNSLRQADLAWRASPAARRQAFYARLLYDQAAAKEVRLFGLGDFLRGRMLAELRSIHRGQRGLDRHTLRVQTALALLSSLIAGGGLIWVVWQVAGGRLPVGDVTMFAIAILGVQGSVSGLISSLAQLAQSMLLFGHYGDVVSAGPDLPLAARPRPLPPLREGIEVRDVWFRYDDEHPWVLRGLSLFIPSGAPTAVVGLNGAGKSTLVKLLCRFYDPARGSIRWDGTDIRDADPAELRQRIGTVFQDYMCYDLTAAENIGVGDLARRGDLARIREAAAQAGADAAVSALPRGYGTMLSRMFIAAADQETPEAGVMLSGGQWQRLALARGLMRAGRDLLILDEPSSGLDADAEHAMHQRLRGLRAGASLLISHRLSSVRDAGVIYVLSGGRVSEQGSHEELMAAGGEYRRLFLMQASGYQADGHPVGGHQAGGHQAGGHPAGGHPAGKQPAGERERGAADDSWRGRPRPAARTGG